MAYRYINRPTFDLFSVFIFSKFTHYFAKLTE